MHNSAARGGKGKTPPGILCWPGYQFRVGLEGVIWAISGAANVTGFLTFSIVFNAKCDEPSFETFVEFLVSLSVKP